MPSPVPFLDSRGNPIVLGPEIGRGGEGTVYDVRDQPHLVAKIYKTPPDRDHAAKLTAMVASGNHGILKLAAWPTSLLNAHGGAPAGFLMPKVSGFRPAFELYGPKLRLKQFPKADWRFLIHAASNTARTFGAVHAAGHVIGDVNHGNLVVGQDATVRLIDCDSFQVSAGNRTWFCTVGVPTHQPPEMQGLASYAGFTRTPNHDNFGLAVLVFQLLCLARHPYLGRFLGSGDPPSIEEAIKGFRYAYGGDGRTTQMAAPPGSLPMDALTPQVRQLFENAFLRSGAQKVGRPTPAQWVGALDDMAGKLRQCPASASHHHLNTFAVCPWCEIEARSNTLLFPAVFVAGHAGADGFMLLWRQVTAVALPGPRDGMPDPPQATPTEGAKRAGRRLRRACAAVGAILLLSEGGAWLSIKAQWHTTAMLCLPLVLLLVAVAIRVSSGRGAKRRLKASRREWKVLQSDWSAPPRPHDPAGVRAGLDKLKTSYDALQAERAAKLRKLHENRKASQMVEYLDRFQIAGAKVRGVGQAKAAVLQSYGIETAADVVYTRVILISGFGPKTVQNLVDWRSGLEQAFRFDPARGVSPSDTIIVENAVGLQRRLLEQKLSAGLADLHASVAQEAATRERLRSRFQQVAPVFAQAAADARAATSIIF